LRFCFIVEDQYLHDAMPLAAVDPLVSRGHRVDVLEPGATVTSLRELGRRDKTYDAYVLKTATDGPGLSILEAAGAAGIPTINHWHAIRLVRDKAVAVARAQVQGLPVPRTYFVSSARLLRQIGRDDYPLVIKPNHGSAGRGIRRVDHPGQLSELGLEGEGGLHLLAQAYVPNQGFDVKLYNTGGEIFAVRWPSPLHPELDVVPAPTAVTPEMRAIALGFGRAFGLAIYGVDLVLSPRGWVAVDVNDFPSFHEVPDAAEQVAASIVRIAERAAAGRRGAGRWITTLLDRHLRCPPPAPSAEGCLGSARPCGTFEDTLHAPVLDH
jgi:ribosomal protein S6--L-glutamate ligase